MREKLKNRPSVEFPANCEWFNTCQPWTGDHLKGHLTLLDFWTYCCVNCMHILPDLEALEDTFKHNDKILVIGVHSAKFDNERIGSNISNAIQRYGIHHPVVNDAQACLWNNLSISCWPTVLLCDPGMYIFQKKIIYSVTRLQKSYFSRRLESNHFNIVDVQLLCTTDSPLNLGCIYLKLLVHVHLLYCTCTRGLR